MPNSSLICVKLLEAYLVFHHHVLHASCFLAKKLSLVRNVLYCGIPGKYMVPASSTMDVSVFLNTVHITEAAESWEHMKALPLQLLVSILIFVEG